ncbi:MAG: hypothetical protein IIA62_05210, partial [Nitrospinae bacterium]|nr:hypothetical protein [Nitrospinota bacterium]
MKHPGLIRSHATGLTQARHGAGGGVFRGGGGFVREQAAPGAAAAVDPEQNRMKRDVFVELSPAGAVKVSLNESAIGRSAARNRALYNRLSEPDYRKLIERWISGGAPAATVETLEVVDRGNAGFDLTVTFSAPSYGQSIAGRLLVFKPAIVSRRNGINLTDTDDREHPVLLGARALDETIRIALPEGYVIDERPSDVTLHTDFGD